MQLQSIVNVCFNPKWQLAFSERQSLKGRVFFYLTRNKIDEVSFALGIKLSALVAGRVSTWKYLTSGNLHEHENDGMNFISQGRFSILFGIVMSWPHYKIVLS